MRNVLLDVLTLKECVIMSIVCRAVRYIITVIIVADFLIFLLHQPFFSYDHSM